ncbi:exonuclease domain-containing protein [Actinocorallia sp. B10E7]|uniref:exonuclease domain-containing protein n=1 Tax=Actinocorallia sp. B10E7 TaxID=3153558 RepID=UPI00325CB8D4
MEDRPMSLSGDYVQDWALVDVETSGLRPGRDRVLSLAVMTVDHNWREVRRYTTLLDPGVDPGPVHIHGLTTERLRGAPTFDKVASRVAEMLHGRVMVAHNARFDYDFLAGEFARAAVVMPVRRRLCTLELNRRLVPPTPDLQLTTLVDYYGVTRHRAHDALGDTLMLSGVLRRSLEAALQRGVELPFAACPPRQDSRYPVSIPKARCPYRNPGRLASKLVQGMKVAFTGETELPRLELATRAAAAGLNVMNNVSRQTSVLVANDPFGTTGKTERARTEGVPVIDEPTFLKLLDEIAPGEPADSRSSRGPGRPRDGSE